MVNIAVYHRIFYNKYLQITFFPFSDVFSFKSIFKQHKIKVRYEMILNKRRSIKNKTRNNNNNS